MAQPTRYSRGDLRVEGRMYGEADERMVRKMDKTTDGGQLVGGGRMGTTVDGQSNTDVLARMATPTGTVLFMMNTPAV